MCVIAIKINDRYTPAHKLDLNYSQCFFGSTTLVALSFVEPGVFKRGISLRAEHWHQFAEPGDQYSE